MSLTGHLLHRAAQTAAKEASRKLDIEDEMAERLAPVAVALILTGFRRNTETSIGAALFGFSLNKYCEDVLANSRRLSDPDVRARGEAFVDRALGGNARRAAIVLADLAEIGVAQARSLLGMTAPAVVSALSKAQRDLNLSAGQLRGVIKSEAAHVDGVDPHLVRRILDWVFAPPLMARVVEVFGDLIRALPGIRRAAA